MSVSEFPGREVSTPIDPLSHVSVNLLSDLRGFCGGSSGSAEELDDLQARLDGAVLELDLEPLAGGLQIVEAEFQPCIKRASDGYGDGRGRAQALAKGQATVDIDSPVRLRHAELGK
mgnify:CR=1 FL=1